MVVFKLIVGSQVIIDQEEFEAINLLKKMKTEYKSMYETLRPLRGEIEYCEKLTDQCRTKLMTEFETWYESSYGPGTDTRGQDVFFVLL